MLLIFVFVAVLSGVFNIDTLMELHFQGTTGEKRFFIQLGALLFYVACAVYSYNISCCTIKDPLYIIEKLLLCSFVLPALYSTLELMSILGNDSAVSFLWDINSLFRSEDSLMYPRVRSVTAEASYFGMYSAIILWQEFPILGCGFGGFGFYASEYYPNWAWLSPEISIWATNTPQGGAWPPVHNIYTRILSELGIIGFLRGY